MPSRSLLARSSTMVSSSRRTKVIAVQRDRVPGGGDGAEAVVRAELPFHDTPAVNQNVVKKAARGCRRCLVTRAQHGRQRVTTGDALVWRRAAGRAGGERVRLVHGAGAWRARLAQGDGSPATAAGIGVIEHGAQPAEPAVRVPMLASPFRSPLILAARHRRFH